MDFEKILNGIKSLASSQGFYGRLYNNLIEDEDFMMKFKEEVERQNFTDFVDFVMWLEG